MTLYIMCGAPGSGKTYYAKNYMIKDSSWKYISRDEIRFSMVKENEEYFSHETEVFNEFVRRIKNAFDEDGIENVIADATHLNWPSRRKLLNALGDLSNINVIPVVIKTNVESNLIYNENRNGQSYVDAAIIMRMRKRATSPATDNYHYANIIYYNNSINKKE